MFYLLIFNNQINNGFYRWIFPYHVILFSILSVLKKFYFNKAFKKYTLIFYERWTFLALSILAKTSNTINNN